MSENKQLVRKEYHNLFKHLFLLDPPKNQLFMYDRVQLDKRDGDLDYSSVEYGDGVKQYRIDLTCYRMSNRIFSYLQVSTNGSFIFDSSEIYDENEYTRVVNPFLSVNDPSTGSISYEVHQNNGSRNDIFSRVNSIINGHENTSFSGSWFLIAIWDNVQQYGKNFVSDTTFQITLALISL